ncbi:sigma-54-dependent Fis family transcriptional regulator [Sporosarcina cascadiensis]|uniref:sigma-54-dependent Fis family transcriptional regulator n=1 Tax=Sporosarcina cascadiensis TaxID=2660747 RepID=UPI00129BE74A|nr:sigma-54-dependent Fis family transcriptional regulator [Sporosarcina cascadiensis]
MPINVLVVAPYPGLANLVREMERELTPFKITLHQADLKESLSIIEEYDRDGVQFDYIVSRGGTANLLRKHVDTPVINIDISGYDILRILTLLKNYNTKIGMVGFKNIINSFETVASVIQLDMRYHIIEKEEDVEGTLKELAKEGIRIVVGDAITVRLAVGIGMQGVLITSGRESVLETFEKIKMMNNEINMFRSKNTLYEQLLNRMHKGICLMEEDGTLVYKNTAFTKVIELSVKTGDDLFKHLPFLHTIVEELDANSPLKFQLAITQFDDVLSFNTGRIRSYDGEPLIYIEVSNEKNTEERGITCTYSSDFMDTVPYYLLENTAFQNGYQVVEPQLKDKKPVVLIGELGTGKRMFVHSLYERNEAAIRAGGIMEIALSRPEIASFNRLLELLKKIPVHTFVHIKGLQMTTPSQQRKLSEIIQQIESQLFLSFSGGPEYELQKDPLIDRYLADELTGLTIFFPPLRDQSESLEQAINTFILYYNEKSGKQIVGMQAQALEKLKEHAWERNFIELREIIKELVHQTEGQFIEEVEHCLQARTAGNKTISLDQPLAQMENDIIKIVLEQENGNQTRTASRLGITRSTLWRKLNQ